MSYLEDGPDTRERGEIAVARLDQYFPDFDWRSALNVNSISMNNPINCPLTQIGTAMGLGSYSIMTDRFPGIYLLDQDNDDDIEGDTDLFCHEADLEDFLIAAGLALPEED